MKIVTYPVEKQSFSEKGVAYYHSEVIDVEDFALIGISENSATPEEATSSVVAQLQSMGVGKKSIKNAIKSGY